MQTAIPNLTDATFDEQVHGAALPVLVDVWAEWCPPCRAMEPVLEAIAAEYGDQLEVCKINGDEHPGVVARYGVMGFPTLLVFHHGELVDRLVGARGKRQLLENLATYIS
jgi:thioredoxin 1